MTNRWNETGVDSEASGEVILAFACSVGLGLGSAAISSGPSIAIGQGGIHFSTVIIESSQVIVVSQNLKKLRLGSDSLSTW